MQSQQETQAERQESTCFDQTSKHCETYLEYDRLVWPWHCLSAIITNERIICHENING